MNTSPYPLQRRAPAKHAPKPSPSKALVRHKVAKPPARKRTPWAFLAPVEPTAPPPVPAIPEASVLGEDVSLGALGLVEIRLTAEEEAILAEPVAVDAVRIKPTGQVYLGHPAYTRWLNRAFGRLGWSLVQAAKPSRAERVVVVPYILHIHGKPVAFAYGEQEYFEGNTEQTYGDALESTVASALRRCAKRLGVGVELWDAEWGAKFLAERAVQVRVQVKNRDGGERVKFAWRLKTAAPFWNELSPEKQRTRDDLVDEAPDQASRRTTPPRSSGARRTTPPPAPATNPTGQQPITPEQLTRLWTIIRKSGRTEADVRTWLGYRYSLEHTKDIKRIQYDAICAAIEKPGPLLGGREPGQEG